MFIFGLNSASRPLPLLNRRSLPISAAVLYQLEVHDGQLLRNGQSLNEPWIAEAITYEMPSVTVPEGELWVMGDNRNASLDSHLWGQLNEADVVGTARWRYWPLADFGPIKAPAVG